MGQFVHGWVDERIMRLRIGKQLPCFKRSRWSLQHNGGSVEQLHFGRTCRWPLCHWWHDTTGSISSLIHKQTFRHPIVGSRVSSAEKIFYSSVLLKVAITCQLKQEKIFDFSVRVSHSWSMGLIGRHCLMEITIYIDPPTTVYGDRIKKSGSKH